MFSLTYKIQDFSGMKNPPGSRNNRGGGNNRGGENRAMPIGM